MRWCCHTRTSITPAACRCWYSAAINGPIYAQSATVDFCKIMLVDSARIAQSDAETENRKRERKDLPLVTPLYTVGDVERTLRQFVPLPYDQKQEITARDQHPLSGCRPYSRFRLCRGLGTGRWRQPEAGLQR